MMGWIGKKGRPKPPLSQAEREYRIRVSKNKRKQKKAEAAAARLVARRAAAIPRGLSPEDAAYHADALAKQRFLATRYNKARRGRTVQATPKWARKEVMLAIYRRAAMLEIETGIPHHVDHVVPLASPMVCGLHCEDNLQVLTVDENLAKHNGSWPDMP